MASSSPLLLLVCFALTVPFLAERTLLAHAATKTPAAPAPAPQPLNLTGILDKSGQYTTLLRLLKETQVGNQIESQLNNSYGGLTLFAPSDNAFSSLKPGTLNGLTAEEQVELVLYHVLPRYYTAAMLQTASNPVRTQATGSAGGIYTLNITSSDSQANISTGIDQTRIGSAMYDTFPLAVYSVDSVLLPYDLFGAKPPAPAPAPAALPKKKKKKAPLKSSAEAPAADSVATPSAASLMGRSAPWGIVMGLGLLSMALQF